MNARERRELVAELKAQGYAYRDLGSWPAKATYYKPTGEALPGLPAEPHAMMKYLKRGLLLYKPTKEQIATHIFGNYPELLSLFAEEPVATEPVPLAKRKYKKKGKSNKR